LNLIVSAFLEGADTEEMETELDDAAEDDRGGEAREEQEEEEEEDAEAEAEEEEEEEEEEEQEEEEEEEQEEEGVNGEGDLARVGLGVFDFFFRINSFVIASCFWKSFNEEQSLSSPVTGRSFPSGRETDCFQAAERDLSGK